jgi:hypothetical protein
LSTLLLLGCGTVGRVTGNESVSTDNQARYVKPEDPLSRPIQTAWTSARAKYCGFMFDPARLKADYLADEQRRGADQYALARLSKTYDETLDSVTATIKEDPNYCNTERLAAIRVDLRRYLSGDYEPKAKLAR